MAVWLFVVVVDLSHDKSSRIVITAPRAPLASLLPNAYCMICMSWHCIDVFVREISPFRHLQACGRFGLDKRLVNEVGAPLLKTFELYGGVMVVSKHVTDAPVSVLEFSATGAEELVEKLVVFFTQPDEACCNYSGSSS